MDFGKVNSVSGIDFNLPPEDFRFGAPAKSQSDAELYTGCPIWSHKDWQGKVYPKSTKSSDFLKYYAQCFSSIELNSTFYHLPNIETMQKWKQVTPESFKFCPKVPQIISHERKLVDVEDLVRMTCKTFAWFGARFGCAFLQLPPEFDYSGMQRLEKFLAHWSKDLLLAVEFRHVSWFENGRLRTEVDQLFRKRGVAPVISDVPGRRDVLHISLTADHLFVRFLGHGLHPSDFLRLEQWAHRFRYWLEGRINKVYFFLHQPDDVLAPETVVEFHKALNRVCDMDLDLPKLGDWEDQKSLFDGEPVLG